MAIKEDFSSAKGSLLAGECAEAAQVFVRWKNIAFAVIILCLLLLQSSFWLVKTGHVKVDEAAQIGQKRQIRKDAKGLARNKLDNLGFKGALYLDAPIEPNRSCSGLQ